MNRFLMNKMIIFTTVVFLSVFAHNSSAQADVAAPGAYARGRIVGLGGSNYTLYDVGRPVIGAYHLNPTLVEAQLRQLRKSGQEKITLFYGTCLLM